MKKIVNYYLIYKKRQNYYKTIKNINPYMNSFYKLCIMELFQN